VSGWFATRQLEAGVHLISEPVHVNSFLVEGSASAALIDTGLGIGNIREVVDALASRDVFALNTHYHFDHTGGNHWFDKRVIHESGADATTRDVPSDPTHGQGVGRRRHRPR
jgi:glyoxylase-like metal-dependent hydrolase (beta-lactamase superfamily II)